MLAIIYAAFVLLHAVIAQGNKTLLILNSDNLALYIYNAATLYCNHCYDSNSYQT